MSKKYKVLKDFLFDTTYEIGSPEHVLFTKDEEFQPVSIPDSYLETLLRHGFIEEVKESCRWRAVEGQKYWSIGINPEWQSDNDPNHVRTYSGVEELEGWDDCNYEGLNYFKSEDTATKVSEALKLFFEWLHNVNADKYTDLSTVMADAREAVLADDEES